MRAASAGDERDDRDEHVDVEVPAPVEVLRQEAAEQQADGAAHAGDRAEDAERAGALLGMGEGRGQHGQRGGGEDRGERALQRAGADEQLEALRGAAEGGGDGEADEADEEHAARPNMSERRPPSSSRLPKASA